MYQHISLNGSNTILIVRSFFYRINKWLNWRYGYCLQIAWHIDQTNMQRVLQDNPLEHPPRRHKWTELHSFYVCTGGFVIDVDEDSDLFPVSYAEADMLAICSFSFGQMWSSLRRGSERHQRQSTTDSLAKAIVLLQAIWFLIQIIARIAQKLPISLLEVNTIGHVLCALVIYLLWWRKHRR
ncbi:hypothetical protein DER46DRAFT_572986 [Fusarium sp. MPI-SDFR-AT-0072]|nr:hypothetical protein DER46DRAFT_572986 [Fusarium sp. MPI-SDFR-AT-0072]